jgi:hypothetical protein
MAITYTWVVKNLTADMRGYATVGFFEMQGVDENGKVEKGSATVCFGGDELKPFAQWTQEAIDAYAQTKQADIEQSIADRIAAQ